MSFTKSTALKKCEVTSGNINSPEAKANMRVLFEVVVKQ
jgi:hypothetical protein